MGITRLGAPATWPARCLLVGADADMMPASSRVGDVPARCRGSISAIVLVPPASVMTTFEPRVEAVNRRHRPSLVPRTTDAESRGLIWKLDVRDACVHVDPRTETSGALDRRPMWV